MKITVLFEGKPIDLSEIEAWEKKHSVAMTKRLQRKYKVTFPDGFIQRIPQMEIKKVRAELVRAKQRIGSEGGGLPYHSVAGYPGTSSRTRPRLLWI